MASDTISREELRFMVDYERDWREHYVSNPPPNTVLKASMARELLAAREELRRHRKAAAFMYQYAGATDAPVEVLDNLSALAREKPLKHQWKYPAGSKTFDGQREELEAARAVIDIAANTTVNPVEWGQRVDNAVRAHLAKHPKEGRDGE